MSCLSFISSARMQNAVPAFAFLLLLASFALSPALPAQAPSDLTIQYTGKLFGYYRIEADESIISSQDLKDLKLPPVRNFLTSALKPNTMGSDVLLLGMGDNFAPEFGASIQQEFMLPAGAPCTAKVKDDPPQETRDPSKWHLSAPEVLYKSHKRMPALADCDNVTRFLMTAGYRAIVPGREDFIYSASWLRRIAFLLKSASSDQNPTNHIPESNGKWTFRTSNSTDQKLPKLHMLAANLRVKVTDPKAKDKTVPAFCPLLFADDLSVNTPCATGDSTITAKMDWLRRIDETLDLPSVENSLERQAYQDLEFRIQLLINQAKIVSTLLTSYKCTVPVPPEIAIYASAESYTVSGGVLVLKEPVKKPTEDLGSSQPADSCASGESQATQGKLSGLATGLLKAIAATATATITPQTYRLRTITPQTHILLCRQLRNDAVDLLLNLIYNEQENVGYTIAKLPSGKHVLIIGVVGQETMQEISKGNFQVYPDENRDCKSTESDHENPVCKSIAEIIELQGQDKTQALDKLSPYSLYTGDPRFAVTTLLRAAWAARETNNFDWVVVMAQMPAAEAQELAAHVRMDIENLYPSTKGQPPPDRPSIDLILSEAQDGYETPDLKMSIDPSKMAPVLTPVAAKTLLTLLWNDNLRNDNPNPVSTATLSDQPENP